MLLGRLSRRMGSACILGRPIGWLGRSPCRGRLGGNRITGHRRFHCRGIGPTALFVPIFQMSSSCLFTWPREGGSQTERKSVLVAAWLLNRCNRAGDHSLLGTRVDNKGVCGALLHRATGNWGRATSPELHRYATRSLRLRFATTYLMLASWLGDCRMNCHELFRISE
jgi:hypothetical protein